MNTTIRRATIEDLDAILRLNKALFDYEVIFNTEYNLDWTYSDIGRNYFKKRIEGEHAIVLVAEEDGNVIGYVASFIDTYPNRSVNPIAEIENIFIDEKYQRSGIGKKLLEKVKGIAKEKGVKRIKVEAVAQNAKAIEFYRSCGFVDFDVVLESTLE